MNACHEFASIAPSVPPPAESPAAPIQNEAPPSTTARPCCRVVLSEIEPQPVSWLWKPYLAKGTVALLSGEPGSGTTYLALAIAADMTRGKGFKVSEFQGFTEGSDAAPASERETRNEERGTVLYLGSDNSPRHLLRPRFDALGGDPSRFQLLHSIPGKGEAGFRSRVSPPSLISLDEALQETGAQLLIVDPLQSCLGKHAHDNQEFLDGLKELAERHDCCILLIHHLSRSRTGRIRARTLGPLDLSGIVATELLAGVSPDDPQARVLLEVRSTIGACGPALGYSIDKEGVFCWTGESDLEASALLAPAPGTEQHSALRYAIEFLQRELHGRAEEVTFVRQDAQAAGISMTTLQRAKERLGIVSLKKSYDWYWQLPRRSQMPEHFQIHYEESELAEKIQHRVRAIKKRAAEGKHDNVDNLASADNLDGAELLENLARQEDVDSSQIANLGQAIRYVGHIEGPNDLKNKELRNKFSPVDLLQAWKTLERI